MKKILSLALLAFALMGGVAALTTVAPGPALADGGGDGGGGR